MPMSAQSTDSQGKAAVGIDKAFRDIKVPRSTIGVESELQLTARESQSQGSDASLDVPEGSMLAMTLLPGA